MAGLVALILLMIWLAVRSALGLPRQRTPAARRLKVARSAAQDIKATTGMRSSTEGPILPIGDTDRGTTTTPIDPILITLVKMGFTKSEARRWAANTPGEDHGERLRQIFQQYDQQR